MDFLFLNKKFLSGGNQEGHETIVSDEVENK